jgi:hypothetical protein
MQVLAALRLGRGQDTHAGTEDRAEQHGAANSQEHPRDVWNLKALQLVKATGIQHGTA